MAYLFNGGQKLSNIYNESWMSGKTLISIGDSLFDGGKFQTKFAELTGCIFDVSLNNGNFSYGGTKTWGNRGNHSRCKKVVDYFNAGNPVDIIFLENVNDGNTSWQLGTKDDEAWFENQSVEYTGQVFNDISAARTYFQNNMSTMLSGITPMSGTTVKVKLNASNFYAKSLKVLTAPTKSGSINIKLYNAYSYNISVTAGMSINDVIKAIEAWEYTNHYDVITASDTIVFSEYNARTTNCVFTDTDNTGVTVEINDADAVVYKDFYFADRDAANWLDYSSWTDQDNRTTCIKASNAIKGEIEYLQKNIPKAKIFMVLPTVYKVANSSVFRRADGTFDMVSYLADTAEGGSQNYLKLRQLNIDICNQYNVKVLDMYEDAGITPINAYPNFYNYGNPHPKDAGYHRWAETIARLLL